MINCHSYTASSNWEVWIDLKRPWQMILLLDNRALIQWTFYLYYQIDTIITLPCLTTPQTLMVECQSQDWSYVSANVWIPIRVLPTGSLWMIVTYQVMRFEYQTQNPSHHKIPLVVHNDWPFINTCLVWMDLVCVLVILVASIVLQASESDSI